MSKKLLYSNTVKRNTTLKIKEIPIIYWLRHYGLEEFHHTIFVEKHIMQAWPQGISYPYEYSHLLINIKTNIDLLFSFNDSFKFKDAISVPVGRKLYKMNLEGLITQDQVQDSNIEYRFFKAFELLLSQKSEYKTMLSLFENKPSESKYNNIIETNLNFLSSSKYKLNFKNIIVDKLKVITFDDLLHCKQTSFNLLLSLPIEDIKKYMLYTTHRTAKITAKLKPSFTKAQFIKFINNNESLKVFESCYNNYDLNYVNKSLKSNFNAKTLLSTHRMDLLEYFFCPTETIESEITEKIYNTFFPDNDHIYINKQFSKIGETIPTTIANNAYMKKTNFRVFFIQGHGASSTITDYRKKDRVDFEKVFLNINSKQRAKGFKPYRYNANLACNIVAAQPVGRKSIFDIIRLLNKILSSRYRNTFLQGLINSNEIEHMRLLENIVNMYWNHYCIKKYDIDKNDDLLSSYLKKSKLKKKISTKSWQYPKTPTTTSDIVNFVKYSYNYKPINTKFHFNTNRRAEGLLGIFELNDENANDLIKLDNKVVSKLSTDTKLHLGLKLNELYEYKDDIPEKTEKILKYNKALKFKSPKNIHTLEDIIKLIFLEGKIKPDEYVIIIDNACRGLKFIHHSRYNSKNKRMGNTINSLPPIQKLHVGVLRAKSIENSLTQFK